MTPRIWNMAYKRNFRHHGDALCKESLVRLEAPLGSVCEGFENELAEFNGEADHVRLLVCYPAKVCIQNGELVDNCLIALVSKNVSKRRMAFPSSLNAGLSTPQKKKRTLDKRNKAHALRG